MVDLIVPMSQDQPPATAGGSDSFMDSERPIVEAHFTPVDLALKNLDSPAWSKATPVQIDHYWSGEPAPVGSHAEALILWSVYALYVRFVCNQAEPLVTNEHPQTRTKTMYLWDRDVCEIFIAPDSN